MLISNYTDPRQLLRDLRDDLSVIVARVSDLSTVPAGTDDIWSSVLEFFRIKIEAADALGDRTYAEWSKRMLSDLARYLQR